MSGSRRSQARRACAFISRCGVADQSSHSTSRPAVRALVVLELHLQVRPQQTGDVVNIGRRYGPSLTVLVLEIRDYFQRMTIGLEEHFDKALVIATS